MRYLLTTEQPLNDPLCIFNTCIDRRLMVRQEETREHMPSVDSLAGFFHQLPIFLETNLENLTSQINISITAADLVDFKH